MNNDAEREVIRRWEEATEQARRDLAAFLGGAPRVPTAVIERWMRWVISKVDADAA